MTASRESGSEALCDPGIYQVILNRALLAGNLVVARAIISNITPAPSHETVFSLDAPGMDNLTQRAPDGSSFFSHPLFRGQLDPGCDFWLEMIRTGWTVPQDGMMLWAETDPDTVTGAQLFKVLTDHGSGPVGPMSSCCMTADSYNGFNHKQELSGKGYTECAPSLMMKGSRQQPSNRMKFIGRRPRKAQHGKNFSNVMLSFLICSSPTSTPKIEFGVMFDVDAVPDVTIYTALGNSATIYGDAGTQPDPFVRYGSNANTDLFAQFLATKIFEANMNNRWDIFDKSY
ncbi:hypothetical protein Micbo1qcDRAFT_173224 [Microdochium bolleyi]|uniref:Uncharacterized protein n=1 Tax=Microdochium bolleyi TaxID=196109 RepID=A0A136JBA0_9PEZI|nr:hypothetical protein Micbo1qcDRAFT_173224 [Microdochium bolleyi]